VRARGEKAFVIFLSLVPVIIACSVMAAPSYAGEHISYIRVFLSLLSVFYFGTFMLIGFFMFCKYFM
jgi:hypothetical protein